MENATCSAQPDEKSASRWRRGGILAIGVSSILLFGYGSYALWSSTANLAGGDITAGNLSLQAEDGFTAWDVSADRDDPNATNMTVNDVALSDVTGHAINDLTEWRIVPGDTVAVALPYTVTMIGDNLVAKLTINADAIQAAITPVLDDSPGFESLSFEYQIFDSSGAAVTNLAALPEDNDAALSYYQDSGQGQASGDDDGSIPKVDSDGTAGGILVLFVSFDGSVTGSTDTGSVADLANVVSLTLEQVRENDPANGGNFTGP